ncbi:ABC transporter permease [Novipirellula rosea]|uniref:ABC transporter permease n=1 Tax=Novipirellula rosea TaxID=1031540 RepID=A0ABP8NC28_9BACT
MTLQPEDFWSFYEWLVRPNAFLESALLQGIVLFVLAILLGLIVGYMVSAARYGPSEGFYAVARTVRDLIRFDLPGTSARRVMALARLAFKEAIRRKVLFVVGLFVVGLLLAGWYLNPESDDPARLYISFVLTATNYLILALALFISAFSLPADIKSKTIYTIVTKPVRPTEIVLGRMLGFVAVGTMMMVPMGLASYLFVTRGLRHTHLEVTDVRELSNGRLEGETDYIRGHKHTFSIDPDSGGLGLTDMVRGHRHVVTQADDGTFTIGPATGALRARIPSYGEVQFYDRQGDAKDAGIDVGNEKVQEGYGSAGIARLVGVTQGPRRAEHGYIEGGTLGVAEFTFSDVTPERYVDGLPLDMSIRAYRSFKGDIVTGIRGSITMKHPDKAISSNPITFIVDEYTVDEKLLPLNIEGTDGNETRMLNVFDDLVDENGQMMVQIRCLDRSQYLGVTKSGVYLRPGENSFAWNLTKAYISIWLQMTMIIAFGVMFSTFLSGPVAMVATAVCVLLGFSAEQVYDTRYYIDSGIERGGGPIESVVRILKQDAMTTQLDVDALAGKVIKAVDAGIVYTLDAIATALPNLPKMVSTAEYAASGFDIFGALLARHAAATLGYCILAFVVSYFFLKSREIAA